MAQAQPPPYRIETERLVIRCWEPSDARLLKDAIDSSLDHLREWLPWAKDEPQELETKIDRLRRFRAQFDTNADFVCGIFSKDETKVIGGTGFHTRQGPTIREIGYWIRLDSINRGFATEAAAAVTRVSFEIVRVPRVEIRCDVGNVRSAIIPPRIGFVHEKTIQVGSADKMVWSMNAEQYAGSVASKIPIRAFDVIGREFVLRPAG